MSPEFYWNFSGFHQSSTGISLWQRQSSTGMAAVSTRVLLEVPWRHWSSTGSSLVPPEFYCNVASRTGVLDLEVHWFHQSSTGSALVSPEFYRSFIRFHQTSFYCHAASCTRVLPAWHPVSPEFYWKFTVATPVPALVRCLGWLALSTAFAEGRP